MSDLEHIPDWIRHKSTSMHIRIQNEDNDHYVPNQQRGKIYVSTTINYETRKELWEDK